MKKLFLFISVAFSLNFGYLNAQPGNYVHLKDSILNENRLIVVNSMNDTLEIAELRKGRKHGKQVLFSPRNKIKQESNFRRGVLNGIQKKYNSSGKLSELYTFKKGKLQGVYKRYHSNGVLAEKGSFKNGLNVDKKQVYQSTGQLLSDETYAIIDNPEYKKARELKSDEEALMQISDKISVLHGEATYYYHDGKISEISHFYKGKKEGRCKTFHQNATNSLASNVIYKDGLEHGEFAYYSSDEKLQRRGIFYKEIKVNDTLLKNVYEGKIEVYQQNGKLQRVEHWKNFKKNGVQEFYSFKSGVLSERSNYTDNLLDGKYETFDKDGNLTRQEFYKIVEKDGELTSLLTGEQRIWEDGKLKTELNYVDGLKNGVLKTYYPSGQLKKEMFYKNNQLDGEYKSYHENGQLNEDFNKTHIADTHENIGWNTQFDEVGNIEHKFFATNQGKKLIEHKFENGYKTEFSIRHLFSLKYGINYQLEAIQFAFLSDPYVNFHLFTNQQLRQVDFSTHKFKNVQAFVDANAKVLQLSNRSNYLIEDEDTKKIAQKIIDQFNVDWSEEELVNTDFPRGKYQWDYADGNPFFEIEFKDDLPHGKFLVHNPISKDTLFYTHFKKGKSSKMRVRKGVDGTPRSRYIYYKNDRLKKACFRYEDGNLHRLIKYDSLGSKTYREEYYRNRNIKRLDYFNSKTFINFNEEGDTLSYRLLSDNKDSLIINREFYSGNKLKSEKILNPNNGKSVQKKYFENSQLRFLIEEREHQREGIFKQYDLDGNLLEKGNYKAGKRHGKWVDFTYEEPEISYFVEGEFQEPEEVSFCKCFNADLPKEEVKFASSLNYLYKYEQIRPYIPPTITPVDDFNYNSIYYVNFIPSNGREVGNVRFKLLFYNDFSFYYASNNHLKFDLIPCKTPGHISNINADIGYDFNNQVLLSSVFNTNRIAVSLENNPLKNEFDKKAFKAYFDTDYIRFNQSGIQQIEFFKTANNCFTAGIINNFMKIDVHQAELVTHPGNLFFPSNFPLLKKERNRFTGLQINEATIRFKLASKELLASAEHVFAGPNYVAGKLIIEGELTDENVFYTKDSLTTIQLSKLKEKLEEQGFYRVKIEVLNQHLSIEFYAEQ